MSSSEYLLGAYRDYSIYVNENRSIPDARDGLKAGQRIALYLMKSKAGKIKTVALAGEMIARELYVHGDAAASESISQLAAPFKNNIPMLAKQGNFGTLMYPKDFASPRYTYVSRPSYANELLYSDFAIVPMIENHDGSQNMPDYFLPMVPVALLNGAEGIGVGYSTNIFPRRLEDLTDAIVKCIRGQKASLKNIEPHFVTVGNQRGTFVKYSSNNRSVYEFRGKIETKTATTITVTDLPASGLNLEKIKQSLEVLIEKGIVASYNDKSASSYNIDIRFARGKLTNKSTNEILELLGLVKQRTENIVFTSFTGEGLKEYLYDPKHEYPDPIERYIREWSIWRFSQYTKRFENLIKVAQDDLLYLKTVKACFDHGLPDRLTKKRDRAHLRDDIMICGKKNKLSPTDDITSKISARPSYSWTKGAYNELIMDIEKLEDDIKEYQTYLKSEDKRRDLFVKEVQSLKALKIK